MMPQRIIFDADLTMGIEGCDIDDGLAILFALGHEKENPGSVVVEGLCTSYGNSTLDAVYANAQKVCNALGLKAPLLKGACDKDHPDCEAARFLVEKANASPGEISLCVTGSTTNLKGAMLLDDQVLTKLRSVVFMGGVTRSLVFNGKVMDELNFSCDPEATSLSLAAANRGARITVMTANNCLPAHFMPDEFARWLSVGADGGYLYRSCRPWFDTMRREYGISGFCCWDVLASAYLLEPELFVDEGFDVVVSPGMLRAGFLEPAFPGSPSARINAPRIADPAVFCDRALRMWRLAIE